MRYNFFKVKKKKIINKIKWCVIFRIVYLSGQKNLHVNIDYNLDALLKMKFVMPFKKY